MMPSSNARLLQYKKIPHLKNGVKVNVVVKETVITKLNDFSAFSILKENYCMSKKS